MYQFELFFQHDVIIDYVFFLNLTLPIYYADELRNNRKVENNTSHRPF